MAAVRTVLKKKQRGEKETAENSLERKNLVKTA